MSSQCICAPTAGRLPISLRPPRAWLSLTRPDLLIFASASQDLIEPATSHIVAAKLGLQCPVMDIKNACNSVLNAMQVADALIVSGSPCPRVRPSHTHPHPHRQSRGGRDPGTRSHRSGGVFTVGDDASVLLSEVFVQLLATKGRSDVTPHRIPYGTAFALASAVELAHRVSRRGRPRLTRYALSQLGLERTLPVCGTEATRLSPPPHEPGRHERRMATKKQLAV